MVRRPIEYNFLAVVGPIPYIELKSESVLNRTEDKMSSVFNDYRSKCIAQNILLSAIYPASKYSLICKAMWHKVNFNIG